LVTAPDGHEFFVDAAPDRHGKHPEDARIAQALCGFAFDMGAEIARVAAWGAIETAIAGMDGLDSVEREIEAHNGEEAAW